MIGRTCSIDGCSGSFVAKGLCRKHYTRVWKNGDVALVMKPFGSKTHRERIEQKIRVDGECLIFTGRINRYGYGQVTIKRRSHVAHRAYYELVRGPIPEGLDLDHLCYNRKCINPDHLEPVTRATNVRRGIARWIASGRPRRAE